MKIYPLLLIMIMWPLIQTAFPQESKRELFEYCFAITQDTTIGVARENILPADFLKKNTQVAAAINGVYYDENQEPMGIVFLADDHHLGNKKGRVSGYFTINKSGTEVLVQKSFNENYADYWLVIGTHPVLLIDGKVDSDAQEKRYAKKDSFRSAIGTRDTHDVCFAVSKNTVTMEVWATMLKTSGYKHAINLDGGPISQLSIRQNNSIESFGGENQPTRLVIFAYKR